MDELPGGAVEVDGMSEYESENVLEDHGGYGGTVGTQCGLFIAAIPRIR